MHSGPPPPHPPPSERRPRWLSPATAPCEGHSQEELRRWKAYFRTGVTPAPAALSGAFGSQSPANTFGATAAAPGAEGMPRARTALTRRSQTQPVFGSGGGMEAAPANPFGAAAATPGTVVSGIKGSMEAAPALSFGGPAAVPGAVVFGTGGGTRAPGPPPPAAAAADPESAVYNGPSLVEPVTVREDNKDARYHHISATAPCEGHSQEELRWKAYFRTGATPGESRSSSPPNAGCRQQ
eukprot:626954-Pyramimonas_sp.AAC.1